MSQAPSTFGTITTSSLSPISVTSVVRSSRTQGESSALIRVQRAVSPRSISFATLTRPARAASLLSTGMASSRLPSRMSALAAVAGSLATIFSFDASKKWIIRDGFTGISRTGSGAPTASGFRKSRGLRNRCSYGSLRGAVQAAATPPGAAKSIGPGPALTRESTLGRVPAQREPLGRREVRLGGRTRAGRGGRAARGRRRSALAGRVVGADSRGREHLVVDRHVVDHAVEHLAGAAVPGADVERRGRDGRRAGERGGGDLRAVHVDALGRAVEGPHHVVGLPRHDGARRRLEPLAHAVLDHGQLEP